LSILIGGSRDASLLFSRYHAATLVQKSLTANLQYPRGKHETERNPDARSGWMSMVGLLRCAAGMPPRHPRYQRLASGLRRDGVRSGSIDDFGDVAKAIVALGSTKQQLPQRCA